MKLQRYQGENQPRRRWRAVAQEEKVFSTWDLVESMEIETGLRTVKKKEGGKSGS